jgi:hypothetical protein
MQHPILADGLQTKDGRSLRFVDNAHLFQWPGALVYGALAPVASDEQQVFENPKDVTDWRRERYLHAGGDAPYPDRTMRKPGTAPVRSARELRAKLLGTQTRPGDTPQQPDNPQFARGNEAQAFEARRNRDRWMAQGREITNPVLDKLGVKALAADWTETGGGEVEFTEGAQWVLDALASDFFNGPIIPPDVVAVLGARQAGAVLAQYLNSPRAGEIVQRFQETIWASMVVRIEEKLGQVRQELFTWARAGQLPVSKPDGGTDGALTLCNAITATVGVYHLAVLGKALEDFRSTGESALAGVLEELG